MAIEIFSTDVISHLKNGVTRKITDKHYNAELGSIQEKYELTPAEVDRLFKHPLLKNVRVKPFIEERFVLVEGSSEGISTDVSEEADSEVSEIMNNANQEWTTDDNSVEEVAEATDPFDGLV